MVLLGCQFFSAGRASMRVGQRVPDALAAKDMAALGRDHKPASVHDLREREQERKIEDQC